MLGFHALLRAFQIDVGNSLRQGIALVAAFLNRREPLKKFGVLEFDLPIV
jgi:hypothetical protein